MAKIIIKVSSDNIIIEDDGNSNNRSDKNDTNDKMVQKDEMSAMEVVKSVFLTIGIMICMFVVLFYYALYDFAWKIRH